MAASRVPAPEQAGSMTMIFGREKIGQFVKDRLEIEILEVPTSSRRRRIDPIPQDVSTKDLHIYTGMACMTTKSCIQGWGGGEFVDRADKAYEELDEYTRRIINNQGCQEPCLIDYDELSHCNLNPGPFKKLICAFLVEAWRVTSQFSQPVQPDIFEMACHAWPVQDFEWIPFRIPCFSQPVPTDTFEATINWAFLQMWRNTEWRIDIFPGYLARNLDFKKPMVLCKKSIKKAFKQIRANQWTLEQVCVIVGNIDEEYFVTCRAHGQKTSDGRCQNAERINHRASCMSHVPPESLYESDCEEVEIPK